MFHEDLSNYVTSLEVELRPEGWFYTERGSQLRDDLRDAYADADWDLTVKLCSEAMKKPGQAGSSTQATAQAELRTFFEWFFSREEKN
jgi:hypothetical protein